MKGLIRLIVILCILLVGVSPAAASTNSTNSANSAAKNAGSIKGKVIEGLSKKVLPGMDIQLHNHGATFNTVADERGRFEITGVPVGNYNLKLTYPGFKPLVKTDVIIKSRRITFLDVDYTPEPIVRENVEVSPGYFTPSVESPVSSTSFTAEEVRRAPGSAGDISRIVANLPSVNQVSDDENGMVVRGGSPTENGFFIDNIEVPNINHFPEWGSTGGPISLLNVDFIKDVNFHSGGFSAMYGDKLSSVMDIRLREGNRAEVDTQFDVNMTGVGLTSEGPLFKGNASCMFSARKSYLDLIVKAIGTGVAPRYSDFQGKMVFDLGSRNKLTFLGLAGFDTFKANKEETIEEGEDSYGDYSSSEYTVGMNWFSMWSQKGYSDTSISFLRTRYGADWNDVDTDELDYSNHSYDEAVSIRNVSFYSFNGAGQVQFGFTLKHLTNSHEYVEGEYLDIVGNRVPTFRHNVKHSAQKAAVFANYIWSPGGKLKINAGVRADYFSYNESFSLSPRLSVTLDLTSKTSVHAASGMFSQNLPLHILYRDEAFKHLKNPTAYHFIAGFNHLFSGDTRLTVDGYLKEYKNMPLGTSYPSICQADHFVSDNAGEFVDSGRARSYGVEVTLQKKLRKNIYGLISGSYFRSRYRDLDGVWRSRRFDNRFLFTVLGGYKPSKTWEFSIKWNFAGGAPYTPYDIALSTAAGEGILDMAQVNGPRKPAYHSLNFRVDKRFHFKSSNLIVFLSLWNVYNQKNISYYDWNAADNTVTKEYSWGLLPILGIEYEL